MFKSITTSETNRSIVSELTYNLALGAENVIARIALAYSISKGKTFVIAIDAEDSQGKTYSTHVLFGDKLPFYIALVCQHYGIYKSNPDIPKYLKMHIDDGLGLIHKEVVEGGQSGIDFLVACVENGFNDI